MGGCAVQTPHLITTVIGSSRSRELNYNMVVPESRLELNPCKSCLILSKWNITNEIRARKPRWSRLQPQNIRGNTRRYCHMNENTLPLTSQRLGRIFLSSKWISTCAWKDFTDRKLRTHPAKIPSPVGRVCIALIQHSMPSYPYLFILQVWAKLLFFDKYR